MARHLIQVDALPDLTPRRRLAKITVRGLRPAAIVRAVTNGSVTMSTTEVSSVALTIPDPDLAVLASGAFAARAPLSYGAWPFTVAISAIADSSGIPTLSVTAMSAGAQKARAERGSLVRRNLSPTDWVRISAGKFGLRFIGQPTPNKPSLTRPGASKGVAAISEYDYWQQLAGDAGFICFESVGVVYFAHPTWLVANLTRIRTDWPSDGRIPVIPTCTRTVNDPNQPVSISTQCADSLAETLLPGVSQHLTGVPTFDAPYLVTGCTIPLADTQLATVTAATPVDPNPTGSASSGSSSAPVGAFVTKALTQVGHGAPTGPATNPAGAAGSSSSTSSIDGGELVAWAAAQAGATGVDTTPVGLYDQAHAHQLVISVAAGKRLRGALLFTHGSVSISLGDGRAIHPGTGRYTTVGVDSIGWTAAARCYQVVYR